MQNRVRVRTFTVAEQPGTGLRSPVFEFRCFKKPFPGVWVSFFPRVFMLFFRVSWEQPVQCFGAGGS